MNTNILKCELFKTILLYSQRISYGFECDLDALIEKATVLRNYIGMVESKCITTPSILREIEITINRINNNGNIDLCTKC